MFCVRMVIPTLYIIGGKTMKIFAKVLAVVLAIAMIASFAGCSSIKSVDDIKESGKITMATESGFEPFEYKEGDDIVGIDVDIAQAIADELGVELEIVDMDFDGALTGVQQGKYDMGVAGITANEERRKNADFSDNYFLASQAIVVAEGSNIKSAKDLDGKTIGVQEGTTGDDYCSDKDNGNFIVNTYKAYSDAVLALKSGKVDAIVMDNLPAKTYVESNDGIKLLDEALTEESYAIMVQKGNTELVEVINKVLKDLKDSGKLADIYEKYGIESEIA